MENIKKKELISKIIEAYRSIFDLKTDLVVISQMLKKSEDNVIEEIYTLSRSNNLNDRVKYTRMIADEVSRHRTAI